MKPYPSRLRAAVFGLLFLGAAAVALPNAPVRVSPGDHKAQGPEIAIGADGAVNMIWIDEDPQAGQRDTGGHGHSHISATNLFFARSVDGGKTFGTAVRVNAKEGDVWGFFVSKPRIAIGQNGTIHVFWPGNDVSPVNGKPVAVAMYTRSTDKGRTFEAPKRLNTMATTDASHIVHGGLSHGHVFGTMAVDANKSVYTFWIDTRDMAKEGDSGKVFMAISRDDGQSFATDKELFPADVCPCCQITAFVDRANNIYVGSRQVEGKFRDSAIAISRDGGRTFSPRQRIVGEQRWDIAGCPLKPTSVAADGKSIYAAFYNGGADPQGVYFVRSRDAGKSYSKPVLLHPGAAVSDAPAIALAGRTLHIFWHAKVRGERRLFTRSSTDGGGKFTEPTEIPSAQGPAQLPAVAVRSDGTVQLAWQQGTEVHSMRWPAETVRVAASK